MSWINDPKFFPSLVIALNMASAAQYALAGQWGKVIYWLSAAFLTFSVTYMMK